MARCRAGAEVSRSGTRALTVVVPEPTGPIRSTVQVRSVSGVTCVRPCPPGAFAVARYSAGSASPISIASTARELGGTVTRVEWASGDRCTATLTGPRTDGTVPAVSVRAPVLGRPFFNSAVSSATSTASVSRRCSTT